MSEATELTTTEPRKAITVTVAERYGMEADAFEVALRNTVFLEGSRAEYAAFLVVCNEYRLNPLTKEIYAFKNKAGKIVPVVSIDGWVSLCNSHAAFDGMVFEDHHEEGGKLQAITCTIFRKDRSHPTVVTEYLSECVRNTEPWKMVHRMLRHKSLIQCARYAFGFSGIYDEDEAERMDAVLVREGTPASLTAAPGFEPRRSPRTAETAEPSDHAREPDGSHHASQEPPDGPDFEEGEFEEASAAEGERPTSTAEPIATADAPAATEPDVTPASAEPASQASPAPTASSPPPAAEGGAPPAEPRTKAPQGVVYTLIGDAEGDDGKVPTYRDGVAFSRAKAGMKTTPKAFHLHADPAPEAEPEREPDGEPQGQAESPAGAGAGPEAQPERALAEINAKGNWIDIKNVLRGAAQEAWWKEAEEAVRDSVRAAAWDRYTDVGDPTEPPEDFSLMRLWLLFGAQDLAEVDRVWSIHLRKPAYRNAQDADKRAMMELVARTRRRFEVGP